LVGDKPKMTRESLLDSSLSPFTGEMTPKSLDAPSPHCKKKDFLSIQKIKVFIPILVCEIMQEIITKTDNPPQMAEAHPVYTR